MAGIKHPRTSDPYAIARSETPSKRPRPSGHTQRAGSGSHRRPFANNPSLIEQGRRLLSFIPRFLGLGTTLAVQPSPKRGRISYPPARSSTTSTAPNHTHSSLTRDTRRLAGMRPADATPVIDLTELEDGEDEISARNAGLSRTSRTPSEASKTMQPRIRRDGSDFTVTGQRPARQRTWEQKPRQQNEALPADHRVIYDIASSDEDEDKAPRPSRRKRSTDTDHLLEWKLRAQLADLEKELEMSSDADRIEELKREVKAMQRHMKWRRDNAQPRPHPVPAPSHMDSREKYAAQLQAQTRDRDFFLQPRKAHTAASFTPPVSAVKAGKLDHVTSKDIVEIVARLRLENEKADEEYNARFRPAVPKTLSADEMNVVKDTMARVSQFRAPDVYSECIESGNMRRLRVGQWLSDDIMAYYTGLIAKRNAGNDKLPDIHYFNTYFYTKLSTQGYSGLRRWTKRVDLFSKDMVLVPINVGNMHWIAAVINFKQKRFEYFDSMGDYGSNMKKVFNHLHDYVKAEHKDKKGSDIDLSDWERRHNASAPQQNNGSDCGIFSCQTLELVARGADPIDKGFEFSSDNMKFFRDLMVYEITTGELKKRW